MKRLIRKSYDITNIDPDNYIKYILYVKNIPAAKLAEMLGVSVSLISAIRKGRNKLSDNFIKKVENATGITFEDYLNYLQDPSILQNNEAYENDMLKKQTENIDANEFIKFLKIATGLNESQILSEIGFSSGVFQKIKQGSHKISAKMIKKIEEVFNLTLNDYNNYLQNPESYNTAPGYQDQALQDEIDKIDSKGFFEFVRDRTGLSFTQIGVQIGMSTNAITSVTRKETFLSVNMVRGIEEKFGITLQNYYEYLEAIDSEQPEVNKFKRLKKDDKKEFEEKLSLINAVQFFNFLKNRIGLSFDSLASRIQLTPDTVSKIRAGEKELTINMIKSIQDRFNISLDDYLNSEEYQTQDTVSFVPYQQKSKVDIDPYEYITFLQVALNMTLPDISIGIGLSKSTFGDISNGRRDLTQNIIDKVEQSYDITINDFNNYLQNPDAYQTDKAVDFNIEQQLKSVDPKLFVQFLESTLGSSKENISTGMGMSHAILRLINNGERGITPNFIKNLEQAYGITIDQYQQWLSTKDQNIKDYR